MNSGPTPGAQPAPLHPQESLRIKALHELLVLDTLPEPMFDDIAMLASQICDTPIALISLIDSERQWFKAKVGLDALETPREMAFCAHAILAPDQVLVVDNALEDARFASNPLVTDDPHIRFYAGAPIVSDDGMPLGTVCAIGREPKHLSPAQARALQALSRQVSRMLTFRRASLSRIEAVEQALSDRDEEAQRLMSFAAMDLDIKSFVDRHYVVRAVNGAYLRCWGRDVADVVGKPVAAVRGAAAFANPFKSLIDRALQGEPCGFEGAILYPAKGLRRMQVTVAPARSPDGDVVGAVIDERDIQDLADAAQKLRDTIAALEKKTLSQQKMIYLLSHDLREPVSTIVQGAAALESRLAAGPDAELHSLAATVRGGGTRLKVLLDDLLNYVRLDQHTVHWEPVDLTVVTTEVLQDLGDALRRSAAVVTHQGLPTVQGDPHLIRIVIRNLVSNAIGFVEPGVVPTVHLSAQTLGHGVRLTVQDNGVGIPVAHQAQLFELFKRWSGRSPDEHAGMGLAICRRIAEMHGGTMGVESEPGRGSRFWLDLPTRTRQP
ncbi:MAG: ATP-binding protein [Acidobacteriota bacterium]